MKSSQIIFVLTVIVLVISVIYGVWLHNQPSPAYLQCIKDSCVTSQFFGDESADACEQDPPQEKIDYCKGRGY